MLSLFMSIANGVSWHELVAPLRRRLERGNPRERTAGTVGGSIYHIYIYIYDKYIHIDDTYLFRYVNRYVYIYLYI